MKKLRVLLFTAFLLGTSAAIAQPYRMSIGGVLGTTEGVSFKMFLSPKLAFQADLGFKYGSYVYSHYYGPSYNWWFWTIEVNPNLKYQGNIHDWNAGGLDWFAGGGLSIGYVLNNTHPFDYYSGYYARSSRGKFGINAIGGVEFAFNKIPLALQFDIRPGYGLLFGNGSISFFDWGCNIGARYTF